MSNQTSTNTKRNEIVKQTKAEVCKGGKPYKRTLSVLQLTELSLIKGIYQRKYGMTSPQWDALMAIVNHWETTRSGISVYAICKKLNPEVGAMSIKTNTMRKVVDLLKDGHVEIVGKGKAGHNLFAPTIRMLNDLLTLQVQSA